MTETALARGYAKARSWPAALLAVTALEAAVLRLILMSSQGWAGWYEPRPWPSILVVHLLAELLVATLPAVGAIAWWTGRLWGVRMLVLGLGASIYAVPNAVGWALANEPALSIGMLAGLLVAVVTTWRLVARPTSALAPRSAWRTALMVWLVLAALQMYALWVVLFVVGLASNPLAPQTNVGYLAGRNVAEAVMIVAGLAGARAWKQGSRGWPISALLALGMFLYGTLNTIGEALLMSPAWIVVEFGMLGCVLVLIRESARVADSVTFGAVSP